MDTPMIDDLITLDTDQIDSSQPLRKFFSFDTVAKSVSQPTDASLVIRSNSLERLVNVDLPDQTNEVSDKDNSERKLSIAIPEDQEGAALTRKATIDASVFSKYEVEGKDASKNGTKKRKLDDDAAPGRVYSLLSELFWIDEKDDSNSNALVRKTAVDYSSVPVPTPASNEVVIHLKHI